MDAMLKLYHAPGTRSMRIRWLLEELQVPFELENVSFALPTVSFSQASPFGKLPALEDGDVTMCESGAILEYLLEKYGSGRLAPPPGTPERPAFLQWVHFAEATVMPPLGDITRHTVFKPEAERLPAVVADARLRAAAALNLPEETLRDSDYLLRSGFSAADIMMGYTVVSSRWHGLLADAYPNLNRYLARLEARPAFQKAFYT
jgi:glutathione S-transferase